MEHPDHKKPIKKLRNALEITGMSVLIFVIYFAYLKWNPAYTECLTSNLCLDSHESTSILAGLQTLFLIVACLTAIATWLLCLWLFTKGYLFHFAGILLITIGTLGIYILFETTPEHELSNFYHIIGIGGFCILLGGFLLHTALRR